MHYAAELHICHRATEAVPEPRQFPTAPPACTSHPEHLAARTPRYLSCQRHITAYVSYPMVAGLVYDQFLSEGLSTPTIELTKLPVKGCAWTELSHAELVCRKPFS